LVERWESQTNSPSKDLNPARPLLGGIMIKRVFEKLETNINLQFHRHQFGLIYGGEHETMTYRLLIQRLK
jgi:hypothetical protein